MTTSIRPLGRFIPKDPAGFLERIAAPERIPAHWWPAVQGCIEAYRAYVGDDLHSVYVRGSVARGEPVDGVSDLDTFAVVDRPKPDAGCWLELEELWPISVELASRHAVVDKIELGLVPFDAVSDDARCRYVRFALAHTAACVLGDDLGSSLPRVKPGVDTVFALPHLHDDVAGLRGWLDEGATWAILGPWIGKRILRAALEWSIDVHGEYSRDLWPCLVAFARKCPEGEPDLRRVLALALDPPEDDGQWREAIDAAVRWLRT